MTRHSKKILITGVSGFLGRYVSRYFVDHGWTVHGIDNSPPENAPLGSLSKYYQLQLPDPQLNTISKETTPDVCINCAGRASVALSFPDPANDFLSNTILTHEILNTFRTNHPACKFINISSAAVYGNPEKLPIKEDTNPSPISPYGFNKLQSERICQEFHQIYNIPTVSVRIFSAYGPGLRRQVLWDICQKALSAKNLTLQGTGGESRDFIHAYDVARALLIIAESAPMKGESYNLATGQETSISELSSILLTALEHTGTIIFDGRVPPGVPSNWKADISKISSLGFEPTIPLAQGASAFARWCRSELVHL